MGQVAQEATTHFGAAHFPEVHVPLRQSVPAVQPSPPPQRGQPPRAVTGPPQSTPVSVPFLTVSAQVAAWHVSWSTQKGLVLQLAHTPLWQSRAILQTAPVRQELQS